MVSDAKAIVFKQAGAVTVKKIAIPDIKEDEILTKTLFSGVSIGTERWVLAGKRSDAAFPCIPGYQNVGKIIALGKKVRNFKVGDHVLQCAFSQLPKGMNHGCGSAHASHLVGNYKNAVPLLAGVNKKQAALAWVAGCSLEGIILSKVAKKDKVLVIGQGLIGQMSAQIARSCGATVYTADIDDRRLELSKRYSADVVINPAKTPLGQAIEELSPGGVDIAIEATGNKKLIDLAISCIKPHGKLCLQGWYPGRISLDFMKAHMKEISIHFPCAWGWKKGLLKVQKLLQQKKINPLITDCVDFKKAPGIYRKMLCGKTQALGIVFKW